MSLLAPMDATYFCILLALAKEPLTAAAIHNQAFIYSRGGAVHIQLSTLCKVLKRLETHPENRRVIESYLDPFTRRAVYQLAPYGRRLLKTEVFRLEEAVRLAKQRLA